ncbi:MAG: tRNA uridine-5-carboxymethylaminomethyl(34) synthesis enzyme MnmG, partial [Candidatus Eisenbacteria bacterium]|nr:tRNA uridine-5-carboxymethylaminomethyl(34) synthesis enzyme MnmG [Candidatus Eisenbacteria bacterium]
MNFDVLIVGGGHAGIEAAYVAARLGAKTALVTLSRGTIGQMSCNPSIGGIAKGHLVREIDALGGCMGQLADRAGIQFRMLNTRKGPAVRAPRAQADKVLYHLEALKVLDNASGLTLLEGCVERIVFKGGRIEGVAIRRVIDSAGERWDNPILSPTEEVVGCRAVILCTGTFLNGKIYRGMETHVGGRDGEPGPGGLAISMNELGLKLNRLKTGTPARLDKATIDFSKTESQPGDDPPPRFSYLDERPPLLPQVSCHITKTNEATHEVIRRNLHRSPLYGGSIEGRGPRYCPSIEDKVVKFPDKLSHLIFLEPEGLDVPEIYPNGISTSLPADVQEEFIRTMRGLERCELLRAGYAVEYDVVIPTQIDEYLGVNTCPGLYLAGQINGTSGYEEAAAQGLIAGINAARWVQGREPFSLRRSEAYIGVLIDDLITKIPTDPYRMFTSNAEFRLLLRQDNADRRLSEKGYQLGIMDDGAWRRIQERWNRTDREMDRLKQTSFNKFFDGEAKNSTIRTASTQTRVKDFEMPRDGGMPLSTWLRRPEITYKDLLKAGWESGLDSAAMAWIEAEIKYEGYIVRMTARQREVDLLDDVEIPDTFYNLLQKGLPGFPVEATENLLEIRPRTLGQAGRLAGVRAAHIDLLSIHVRSLEGA